MADETIEASESEEELVAVIDALWRERLTPFEENLRTRRRAPRRRTPILTGPDDCWRWDAARLVDRLHAAVGGLALRIDHIGSTSVPGLRAKDLIDIQVTVRDRNDATAAAEAARDAGFVHMEGEWFGEDRFGVEHPEDVAVDADPGRPTNVNFRSVTAPVWRDALLFRDRLRARPDERASYQSMKETLAAADDVDVDHYSKDKMPWIRAGLARAELGPLPHAARAQRTTSRPSARVVHGDQPRWMRARTGDTANRSTSSGRAGVCVGTGPFGAICDHTSRSVVCTPVPTLTTRPLPR